MGGGGEFYCPAYQDPSEKESKGKNLLLKGSKFIPFTINSFSERRHKHFKRVVSHESIPMPVNQSVFLLTVHLWKMTRLQGRQLCQNLFCTLL